MTTTLATRTAKNVTAKKAEWLEERQTYLGATDIGAILGLNPYKSPHDVWLEKKGLAESEDRIQMRAGTYMEAFIAKEFQNASGRRVRKSKLYRHHKFPFLASNPDREVTLIIEGKKVPALLECKVVGYFASQNFGQDGSDQIPEHYMMQVLWQMITSGRKVVVLAALVDNRELRTFYYTLDPAYSTWAHVFDPDTVKRVFNFAIKWWRDYIEADIEPPMTGHESDHQYLQKFRPTYENGGMTNTDEETDELCQRLMKAKAKVTRAKYVEAELSNRIKSFMAKRGASVLESTVGEFTYKTNVAGTATFKTPFKSNRA